MHPASVRHYYDFLIILKTAVPFSYFWELLSQFIWVALRQFREDDFYLHAVFLSLRFNLLFNTNFWISDNNVSTTSNLSMSSTSDPFYSVRGRRGTNHQVAAPPSSSVRADCWEDAGVPEVNRTTGFCRWAPLSSVQSKLLWVGQSTACYIWCKMSTSQNWKCTWQAAAGSACLSENRTDWMPSPLSLKFRVILYEEARSTDYY